MYMQSLGPSHELARPINRFSAKSPSIFSAWQAAVTIIQVFHLHKHVESANKWKVAGIASAATNYTVKAAGINEAHTGTIIRSIQS